jgi:hypothetical protein
MHSVEYYQKTDYITDQSVCSIRKEMTGLPARVFRLHNSRNESYGN